MLAGQLYTATDPELSAAHLRAQAILAKFNATSADAEAERHILLTELFERLGEGTVVEAGIDEAIGDLPPDQKIEKVRELEKIHGAVGMIGDGVNDAPALAAASVGIAMGAGGTDTAIETADVALIKDDLLMVPAAIRLGRRTVSMIRFNIAFSLAVKATKWLSTPAFAKVTAEVNTKGTPVR